jgi:hypothetical protein
MERSDMRDSFAGAKVPGFAPLNPGYEHHGRDA